MEMKLNEIAQALGINKTYSDNPTITNVVFDSRKACAGSLFVPLVAERDGHDFVSAAFNQGAVATFWQKDHKLPDDYHNYLVIDDSLTALRKLSKYYLNKVAPKVVAITGSNGKTTTKDMTAAVLAKKYKVYKTQANFNNEIGVPITILGMDNDTQILVVEMGMDHAGQLTKQSALTEPDVAIITMIGEAHIEFFGTRAKIADAKMEITKSLKQNGIFIYDGDEPLLTERAKNIAQAKETFGLKPGNDIQATDIAAGMYETEFKTSIWPSRTLSIPMMGDYNVNNALPAILVGQKFEVQPCKIADALANFQPTKNRTQWVKAKNGARLLSDVYNANPTAMIDVIENFSKIKTTGRRILVLGDMLELGKQESELHASVAQAIHADKIDEVYLFGDLISSLRDALQGKIKVNYFNSKQQSDMIEQLQTDIKPDDIVLLKASNGMHLDKVMDALK